MSDNIPRSSQSLPPTPLPPNSTPWLEAVLIKNFEIPSLRDFQLHHSRQIIDGNDLMLVTATGQGKTIVLLAGIVAAHERGEDAVCVYVAPTKALVEQQASRAPTVLRAAALNEDTLRAGQMQGRDLFKELKSGRGARLAIMTPQMFTGSRFAALLRSPEFKKQVKFVAIDEAHLVDDLKSGPFVGPYNNLHVMRNVLPSSTTWVLATGSATIAQEQLIAKKLSLIPGKFIRARHPLDRPNITYDIRFLEHPTSTGQHLDLSFLVPPSMSSPSDIEPTIVFYSTFARGYSAMRAIDSLLPPDLPDREQLTRMYGSIFSPEYKTSTLSDLQDPTKPLRVIFATDAVTFGMDAHGIMRVVIADPTMGSLNTLKQQIGRIRGTYAAQAIILVPQWVKIVPDELIVSKQQQEDRDRRSKLPSDLLRFLNAGRTDGYHDQDERAVCPRALDCLLNGEPFNMPERCCNVHADDPSRSSDLVRISDWAAVLNPSKASKEDELRTDNTYRSLARYPAMRGSLAYVLDRWARRTYTQSVRNQTSLHLPSTLVFPRSLLDGLPEKAHLCTSLPRLELVTRSILPNGWSYFDQYGKDLLKVLQVAMGGYTDIIKEASAKASLKLAKMRKDILSYLCIQYGLSASGKKQALLDSLVEYFEGNEMEEPSPDELARIRAELDAIDVAKASEKDKQQTPPPEGATSLSNSGPTSSKSTPLSPSKKQARPRPKPKARKRSEEKPPDKENEDPSSTKRRRLL